MASALQQEGRSRARVFDTIAGIALTVGAIAFVMDIFVGRSGFDFGYVQGEIPGFFDATKLTFYATSLAYFGGMGIGFLVGWARAARSAPLARILHDRSALVDEEAPRWETRVDTGVAILFSGVKHTVRRIADGYVEIIRGTPLFVQIVFAWSVLIVNYPRLNQLELIAGIVALTVNTGAYQGEIFRAGLQTVHSGQVEAARAIGLSRWRAMRYVILPQALRLIIPPLTNEYIGLLKASSLLLVIGVQEITGYGRSEAFRTFKVFEAFAMVTGIYLLITIPLSKVVHAVEMRYRIPGLGIQAMGPQTHV